MPHPPVLPMRSTSHLPVLRRTAVLTLLAVLAACGGDRFGRATAFRGVALPVPLAKPSFTLTNFDGEPYDFLAETRDKVALVFFGYTHCPDVCPLHMANIAAVLKTMPFEERQRIVTIFVTTDPERDTPERLKSWLANFDTGFVGLTGAPDELVRVQQAFNIPPAVKEYPVADSAQYFVGHAAQVFAFARDGYAYLIYPFGIRQEDWAADLPRLARDASAAGIRRALAAAAEAEAQAVAAGAPQADVRMGGLFVTQAAVAEPPSQTEAALYLVFRNDTPQEDTLVAVAADLAVRAEIHETMGAGEMRHMMQVPTLVLPARSETRLVPGGMHVMLFTLKRALKAGDTVTVYLSLARAGALEAQATVVPYAELEKVFPPAPPAPASK